MARVSLVGVGMKSHPGIAATMFETLADEKINIDMISTSTIRTSCIVAESDVERAVRSLHAGVRPGLMPAHAKGSRTLWLLRHAKAVTDPPPGGADFDRVLGPPGPPRRHGTGPALRRPARRGSGSALKGVPLPQVALVSPAARTAQTAELVLAGMAEPPEVRLVDELYGADPDEVLAVAARPGRRRRLRHGGRAQPHRGPLSRGLVAPRRQEGSLRWRRATGSPTCALGVYAFKVDRWADVAAGTAKLTALLVPPYGGAESRLRSEAAQDGGVALPATTAERRRQPWRRRAGAARAAR